MGLHKRRIMKFIKNGLFIKKIKVTFANDFVSPWIIDV